ncbi:hypothetical protein, partial [Lactococcus petauri]|uniref:hypothetical protein n=1 Tax=Lactococcus petauri TaxID=1940789 RepID=UPI0021F1C4D3
RKAVGGGVGVMSCCVVATGAMIGGAMVFGTIFSFLAPIIILSTLRQKSLGAATPVNNPAPAANSNPSLMQ